MAILDIASARFRRIQALQDELETTRALLDERKYVQRAKTLLSRLHGLDEESAHSTLRQLAMNQRISLGAAAKNVIATLESIPRSTDKT